VNVSGPFIRRPIATSLLGVAVLLGGILGYFWLPISSLPQVDFPTIQVTTQLPGASPDTMAALVLPFASSAFGTFLVRQALVSVPDEIIEAARMDGASEWTIVYRILGPMLRPTLVSLFLVSFVFHYNDYFWPLVMTTGDRVRTLPLGVALLREQGTGVRWHIVMAGNVVLSAPVIALFAVAQRHLLRAVRA